MLRHITKRLCPLTRHNVCRPLSEDRTEIAYEPSLDAPSVRLALHFHISGHDDVALERFIKHTSTYGRQVGFSVDGRVALPTTVEKIAVKKPANKYTKLLDETIYLKTHRRIVRISDIPGTELSIMLDAVYRSVPPGAHLTVHDEKTEPLSEELLRLLKGGKKMSNVDSWTGVNPLLHRWINANFDPKIKDPIE